MEFKIFAGCLDDDVVQYRKFLSCSRRITRLTITLGAGCRWAWNRVDNPKWAWYATLSNWKDVHNAETFE